MNYPIVKSQLVKVTFPPISGKDVPEFVSRAFVGKKFPYFERVRTFLPTKPGMSFGYKINLLAALAILREEAPEAAQWISDHPEIFSSPYLFFNEESCISQDQFCPQSLPVVHIQMHHPTHVLYGGKIIN
ncbi:MAG: hypothetical protein V1814_00080 [Candidatus Moraniibacteriota bacterium]